MLGHILFILFCFGRSLAKVGLATEITEKRGFKSLFSKVSVHSVAVALAYARGQVVF